MKATLDENRNLLRTSPSALQTFRRCNLRWYHDKVLKTPSKVRFGAGAELGKKEHDLLETWLKTGQDVRGRIASAVGDTLLGPYLADMPFRGGVAMVEGELVTPEVLTPAGIQVAGRYDVYIPGTVPVVIDHKFKASKDYFTSEGDLYEDEQAIIYGYWAMLRDPEARYFEFRHHNHQTKGRIFGSAVVAKFTRDDILKKFGAISKDIDTKMAPCAKLEEQQVAFNTNACWDYGGCAFLHACHKNPARADNAGLERAIMAMSFKKKVEAAGDEILIVPPETPLVPEPVVEEPVVETPAVESAPVEKPKKASKKKETYCLYINCAPNVAFTEGLTLVTEAATALAKAAGLNDVRAAGPDHALGYGKWKPALVEVLRNNIPAGNIVIYRNGDFSEVLIEALTPGALMIVRG